MFLRSGGQGKNLGPGLQSSRLPKTQEATKGVERSVSGTSGDLTPQVTNFTPQIEMTSERVKGIVTGWEPGYDRGNPFLTHNEPTQGAQSLGVSSQTLGGPSSPHQGDVFSFLSAKEKANLDVTLPSINDTLEPGVGDVAERTEQVWAQAPQHGSLGTLMQNAETVAREAKARGVKLMKRTQRGLSALTSVVGVDEGLSNHSVEMHRLESRCSWRQKEQGRRCSWTWSDLEESEDGSFHGDTTILNEASDTDTVLSLIHI